MKGKESTVGRPSKYDNIDLIQVFKLASFGLTEEQICSILDICYETFRTYKKQHAEFLEVLKKGKNKADAQVIKSLYQRATGYNHPELFITTYKGEIIEKEINKHYPPDVGAICFWLKNRQPDKWRDKQDVEFTGEVSYELSDKFIPDVILNKKKSKGNAE